MTDNCLIAHELVGGIKQRTKGKLHLAALKIDMFKAYDKVDWDFLDWLLSQMRFPAICHHWIMQCVTTVSYSILINGEPSKRFIPSCGLRQGDPLSSYLFILVMEILSRMLVKGTEDKIFQGIKLSRTGPAVSHLFFADDSLIFFKASPEACEGVKNILAKFSRISGEVINYHKSLIMFSPNTPLDLRNQMRSIVNTPSADSIGKYLGCNIEVNGRNTRQFHPLIEKVEQRLSSWHHLSLSIAGRVMLINSVLSMLSLHILSVFLIPKTTAGKLNSIFARFLWAGSRASKPIYWINKSTLELPKGGGGLGIRNVNLFNKALLTKQAVRIHNSSHSLISQIYCAKYRNSPVNLVLQKHKLGKTSWGFRGLCRAIQECSEGFAKVIGNGADTYILKEKWLKGVGIETKQGIDLEALGLQKVRDLMHASQNSWNPALIWKVFSTSTAIQILSTHIPTEECQDHFKWIGSKSGALRVKDVYAHLLMSKGRLGLNQNDTRFWSKLWATDLLPKWKFFVWRLLHKALATNSNLIKRKVDLQKECYICHQHMEDESHLFRDCDTVTRIWSSSNLGIKTSSSKFIPFGEWIKNFLQFFWKIEGVKSERANVFVATLWSIWIYRNNIVFRHLYENPITILKRTNDLVKEFSESNRLKESYRSKTSFNVDGQQRNFSLPGSSSHQGICVILVDGAWKRYSNKFPRAGIGWAAYVNEEKLFEGNEMVMASSALLAEALAIHKGLYEAQFKGIRHLQIHSDSKEVVRACESQDQAFEITPIISDIMAIRSKFTYCEIKYVSRLDVTPAHRLAVAARLGFRAPPPWQGKSELNIKEKSWSWKLRTKKMWVPKPTDPLIIEKPSLVPVQKVVEFDQVGFQRSLKPIKGEYATIYLMMQAFKLFSNTSGLQANKKKCSFYCMSVLKEVVKLCRAFLWSGQSYSNKPGNIAWENLCTSKQDNVWENMAWNQECCFV
ncbi:uncharacterized protein LOC104896166 [Beta vulgaris subsp. vulgaris]|uniref:uncharacterized protein LOC104896166 n=1 Tax=Beta vulgaris subsp. vulgaris TaxID=3555 RepID=UPI002036D86B|nr:uncharacterized protein LOC104896166 [Beta vulgaris subsp. vulgaris]